MRLFKGKIIIIIIKKENKKKMRFSDSLFRQNPFRPWWKNIFQRTRVPLFCVLFVFFFQTPKSLQIPHLNFLFFFCCFCGGSFLSFSFLITVQYCSIVRRSRRDTKTKWIKANDTLPPIRNGPRHRIALWLARTISASSTPTSYRRWTPTAGRAIYTRASHSRPVALA